MSDYDLVHKFYEAHNEGKNFVNKKKNGKLPRLRNIITVCDNAVPVSEKYRISVVLAGVFSKPFIFTYIYWDILSFKDID